MATITPHDTALGFTSQLQERNLEPLSVRGRLPAWLAGTLIRNGPAQFEVGAQAYRHWFDGLAMLHAFSIAAGKVNYTNRFLRGRTWGRNTERGRIRVSEFATDPCHSRFKRIFSVFFGSLTDNCNVNVTRLADRFVAMTETPMALEFDPETLNTLGNFEFADSLKGQLTTAHPHHDGQHGETFNYLTKISHRSEYQVYRLPAGSRTRQLLCKYPTKEPAYMHSFGLTPRYVILVEFPLRLKPLRLLLSGKPFIENYHWQPQQPARFLVFERDGGKLHGVWETDPFFAFHHVNAWERGSELVVDICSYPDADVVRNLYLDQLRHPTHTQVLPTLERFVLGALPKAQRERLGNVSLELPRVHYTRVNGREYRHAYGVVLEPDTCSWEPAMLAKVDVASGTVQTWTEPGCYPGEGVFVPQPGAGGEDAGVVLSVVLDAPRRTSFLLVLDGQSFQELARAEVKQHIPFGFHGQFF